MIRSAESLDGLGLLGPAQVGGLSTSLPALLWSEGRRPERLAAERVLRLERRGSDGGGHRRLALRQGSEELRLDLPILAPEVSGEPGAALEVAPGAWYLHAPLRPEAWEPVRAARPALVILGNARRLWQEGESFVRAIGELRRELGAAPILWAPRTALPHRLAFLAFSSVDLVDTTEGLWEAGPDELLDAALGRVPTASSRAEEMCRCPGCSAGGTDAPVRHALEAYADEMARVRSCMRSGRLRELVELRLTAEPALAEMLRYADRWLAERLEERTPVVGQATRGYVLRESFRRPEVARYRQRLRERYRPPPSKEVLLLLPCSKTKPYRNSRSHRRFIGAIGTPPRLERLQVASVTSPLGVVPRELEDLYPARHYDIPVTGEWDEAERAAVREGVAHLLHSGTYRSVVVHLDPAEYDFLRDLLPATWPAVWTLSDDRTASPAALRSLHDSVGEMLERLEPVEGGPLAVVKEELAALAAFQFGRRAAERLFQPPVRLKGRPWFQHLFDGEGVELATWQETRGLFHLTVAGGRRMMPDPALAVTIDPAVPLSGDLFTPGVLRADPAIRVGDAVLVVRAGELAAVGEAELPGPLMTQLPRGKAVTVRHRVHAPAGERPTPT